MKKKFIQLGYILALSMTLFCIQAYAQDEDAPGKMTLEETYDSIRDYNRTHEEKITDYARQYKLLGPRAHGYRAMSTMLKKALKDFNWLMGKTEMTLNQLRYRIQLHNKKSHVKTHRITSYYNHYKRLGDDVPSPNTVKAMLVAEGKTWSWLLGSKTSGELGFGPASWLVEGGKFESLMNRAAKRAYSQLYVTLEGIGRQEQILLNKLPKKTQDTVYRLFQEQMISSDGKIKPTQAFATAVNSASQELGFAQNLEPLSTLKNMQDRLIEDYLRVAGVKQIDRVLYGQAKVLIGLFFLEFGKQLNRGVDLDEAAKNAYAATTSPEGLSSLAGFFGASTAVTEISEMSLFTLIQNKTLGLSLGRVLINGASKLALFGGAFVQTFIQQGFEVGALFNERLSSLPYHLQPQSTLLDEPTLDAHQLRKLTEIALADLGLSKSGIPGASLGRKTMSHNMHRHQLRSYQDATPLTLVDVFKQKLGLQLGSENRDLQEALARTSLADSLVYTGILMLNLAPGLPVTLTNLSFMLTISTALSEAYESWKYTPTSPADLNQVDQLLRSLIKKDSGFALELKHMDVPYVVSPNWIKNHLERLIELTEYNRQQWRIEIARYAHLNDIQIQTALRLTHQYMRAYQIRKDRHEDVLSPIDIAIATVEALNAYRRDELPTHAIPAIDHALRAAYYSREAVRMLFNNVPWLVALDKPTYGCSSDMTSCLTLLLLRQREHDPENTTVSVIEALVRDHVLDNQKMFLIKQGTENLIPMNLDSLTVAKLWTDAFENPAKAPQKRIQIHEKAIVLNNLAPGTYDIYLRIRSSSGHNTGGSGKSVDHELLTFKNTQSKGTKMFNIESIQKRCEKQKLSCSIFATHDGEIVGDLNLNL